MKKSALQQARAAYQPKLPIVLTGAVKAVEGEPTQSVADQEDIKNLFPNTYGLPELKFEKNTNPAAGKPINVGVILSGGQAPGGHNVISGLFDGIKKIHKESKIIMLIPLIFVWTVEKKFPMVLKDARNVMQFHKEDVSVLAKKNFTRKF